jgi:RNA polymerase sigma-70 factor (ECF subfamily)
METLLQTDTDIDLMLRLKGGDQDCMDLLLQRHYRPICNYIFQFVRNRDTAEELAQTVFLNVYVTRARYQPTAKFNTWLYRIARNLSLNWIRSHGWARQSAALPLHLADRRPNVERMAVQQVSLDEIRSAIAELPGKQRRVVLMHKYEGLEYRQIAENLGCSLQAVRSLLFRAYSSLRVRLAHLEPMPESRAATCKTM